MYDEIIELKKVLFLSALGWRYAAKPSTAMGVSWGSCGKGAGHRATLSLHRGGRPVWERPSTSRAGALPLPGGRTLGAALRSVPPRPEARPYGRPCRQPPLVCFRSADDTVHTPPPQSSLR